MSDAGTTPAARATLGTRVVSQTWPAIPRAATRAPAGMMVGLFGGLNTTQNAVVSKQKSGRCLLQRQRFSHKKAQKMTSLVIENFPRAYRRLERRIRHRVFVLFVAKMVRSSVGFVAGWFQILNIPCR